LIVFGETAEAQGVFDAPALTKPFGDPVAAEGSLDAQRLGDRRLKGLTWTSAQEGELSSP
jgi:hypothetical protein